MWVCVGGTGTVHSSLPDARFCPFLPCTQVMRRVVRPGYGEVMVYEHELVNPFSSEMVGGCHWLLGRAGVLGLRVFVFF